MDISHNDAYLSGEEHSHSRWALAVNPETPPDVLEQLAICGCLALLERIAEHPQASRPLLIALATHDHPIIRSAVAENCNTPDDIVAILAQDECADVRYSIAENARMPVPILELLAEDENPYVAHRARTTLCRVCTDYCAPFRMPQGERRRIEQLG